MKKSYLIFIALIAAAALLTSAFVFLSPLAGKDGPGGGDDADDVGGVGENAETPGGEDAGDGEPEPGPEPDEAAEAARLLESLGIVRGTGANGDETAEPDLGSALTREQAVVLIARARGYTGEGADMAFPCPFGDVSEQASGPVGYLKCSGVVSGYSETSFQGANPVSGREFLSMALRCAGYDGFAYADIMTFAANLGLTDGRLGDGTEPIACADAFILLKNLLTLPLEGTSRTLLTVLAESGLVAPGRISELGLDGAAADLRTDAVPASAAADKYAPLMVEAETSDLKLDPILKITGVIVGQNLVALPLQELRGAAYLKITDAAGNDVPYTSISYDLDAGLAFLNCQAAFPDVGPAAAPGERKTDLAYVYSGKAAPILGPGSLKARPGLPVMDSSGNFVGITTNNGVAAVSVPEVVPVNLYDLGKTFWPDAAPKFKPHGVDPAKPMVAVTYDDGPSKVNTPKLLDILAANNAVATFFECGYMLVNNTGSLQRMESMGCEIGNHSYSHANLNKLSAAGIRDEIARTNDLIRGVVGHDAAVVRAPYGNANATVRSAVDTPLIQWNVDTLDWKSRSARSVVNKVFANSNLDGSVILMHSLYSSTVEASRTVIPRLIEKGYQLVTVSELAYFRGVEMQNGVLYSSFRP